MLVSALACQSLPHYSDFDTTSESGLSELSYVLPYRPKRSLAKNKRLKTSPGVIRLGARAMRRHENEVYLHTLAAITEIDGDNIDDYWPDSFNYCSAFTKLLEDENIRAAWDAFIKLSEKEQEEFLGTLHAQSRIDDEEEVSSSDEDDVISSYPSTVVHHSLSSSISRPKRRHVKHRCRRSRREERNKQFTDVNSLLLQSNLDMCISVQSESDNNVTNNDDNPDLNIEQQQQHISARLPSLLSDYIPVMLPVNNVKHNRKRCKRLLTPTDLYLLQRVELELREYFFSPTNANNVVGRWTPSLSLLTQSMNHNCTISNTYPNSNLLCLNSFQRLLIHSVASYLGLNSYSTWSNSLGERQLWVERILGKSSQPPTEHFVTLTEQNIIQSSSSSLST
ncbi:unnamed protein product [Schistosoma turkestanicum]|nr:unnamed protein product [Schistosoma turkestanicum]